MVSLLLAIAMNIDTVTIWQRAVSDKTMRESLVALASKVPSPDFIKDSASENKSVPGNGTDAAVKAATQNYQRNLQALTDLGLPIGWTPENVKYYSEGDWRQVLAHILGIAISAFAASLGAPFWFDMLQKFMNIRGVVKPEDADTKKKT
jgi:hypothetical protein